MARIAGVDLPREKRVEIALTYIYGIGRKTANDILAATGVNPDTRVKAQKLPPHKDNIKELKFRVSKAEVCAMIGTYFCFCQFIYSSMIVSDIFSKDIERGMFNPYIACGISRKKILLLVSGVTNPRDRELPTLTLLGKIL